MANQMKIQLRQISASTSEATMGRHQVLIDRPTAKGGADAGPMGGELFLAGLLNGRSATTHWIHAANLAERFPDIRVDSDKLIIDDGDIITAGGVMAWVDLGLHLINRWISPAIMMATVLPRGRCRPRAAHLCRVRAATASRR